MRPFSYYTRIVQNLLYADTPSHRYIPFDFFNCPSSDKVCSVKFPCFNPLINYSSVKNSKIETRDYYINQDVDYSHLSTDPLFDMLYNRQYHNQFGNPGKYRMLYRRVEMVNNKPVEYLFGKNIIFRNRIPVWCNPAMYDRGVSLGLVVVLSTDLFPPKDNVAKYIVNHLVPALAGYADIRLKNTVTWVHDNVNFFPDINIEGLLLRHLDEVIINDH